MVQAPGDRSRFFVGHRSGVLRMFENREDVSTSSVVLDLSSETESVCAECGMLGVAFHPNFPATPRVYVSYTSLTRTDKGPDTHLSEFTSHDGGLTLDPASERILLTVTKISEHHHGGNIIFGKDGYLYMSVGDGNEFRVDRAQQMNTVRGKFIRIDVNGTTGTALYRIPPTNPFADKTALCNVTGTNTETDTCPEIYAVGFRNPWRWSFDRQTGEIWEGDVGESTKEEVNRVVRGGNYGWRCYEGTLRTSLICTEPTNPLPPIAEYDHHDGGGQAVTGGYVYRGTKYPALIGHYIFGDFVSGRLWDIPNTTKPTVELTGTGFLSGLSPSSFAEDLDGEIYLVNIHGSIFHIKATDADPGTGVATQLSATGCVDPLNPTQPASGLIPYKPSAPFWSDGALKERWMALPDDGKISVGTDSDWDFPNGTVLMKNFHLNNRLIETRLFMRHPDGVWAGYTYEWNTDQTDAKLVKGGKIADLGNGQQWIYPSESDCMFCHNSAAGNSLGLETRQLATKMTYPQTGFEAHQLVTLNTIGVMEKNIDSPETQVAYPDPSDTSAPLADRARSYLHTNCSLCHRPGGPTNASMDLRFDTKLASTNACNAAPSLGNVGLTDPKLIAPGHPEQSVLLTRMKLRGSTHQMPPVGSLKVDDQGVALINDWIASLSTCD